MIVLQKSVPEIYYNQSRNFQALARAFEVLFNYIKTNADVMEGFSFSNNFDVRLLTLLAYTLGFNSKHDYNTKDLFNLCSSFAELLKKKGSLDAIDLAVRTLLNAQQIKEKYDIDVDTINQDKYNLIITLPYGTKDIILLEDIFDYILPTGFTYTFQFANFTSELPGANLGVELSTKPQTYTSDELGGVASENASRFDFDNPQEDLQQVNTSVVVKPQ